MNALAFAPTTTPTSAPRGEGASPTCDALFDEPRTVSVVVCAYTLDRWGDLCACIESLQMQSRAPDQVLLVIDHQSELYELAGRTFRGVTVVENAGIAGLSGARNSGIAHATGDVVAFLDDDATASPHWVERLLAAFDSHVVAVGGYVEPVWKATRPRWFPAEFNWVVGCSWIGLPTSRSPVRNLIGANMAFRRETFERIGMFTDGIGRVETNPVGCEETELCIRAHQHWPTAEIRYEPAVSVQHHVAASRNRLRYFLARCVAEGKSKAIVARLVGASDGLSRERTYAVRVLPAGVLRGLGDAIRGDAAGAARAVMITGGLLATAFGYARGVTTAGRK